MNDWQDRVVVVTGGSSGLGRVIADAYAAAGANVVIAALEPDAVAQAAEEMRACGGKAIGIHANLTLDEDVDRLFAQTHERFGRLDVLVNNAGRSMRGAVLDTTPDQFQKLMELNFIALVRCTRAAVPLLLQQRGHVVNIGSLAAKSAAAWVGAYPATKFAVAAYSQQLRIELGPKGLHVLLVCPGPVRREAPRLYPLEGAEGVPEHARGPGAGVHVSAIPPERLAAGILRACRRRQPELVIPARAKWLFAIAQLWPTLGDWIVRRSSS
ncbi:MAG: SDR family NAD(P)-dependent oxidoreductase [Thermoguttaceae bacterium]